MAGVDRRVPIRELLAQATEGDAVTLTGWIKTARFSKNVSFVHIFDGSTPKTVQVVLRPENVPALKSLLTTGTSVRVTGTWVKSPGGKQKIEVAGQEITVIGACDGETYPIQRKRATFEFLRTKAHLRPRSNTHQSVFRVRNALSWQIHSYFQSRGFLWIHTPIITGADAEGAGEVFPLGNAQEFFHGPAFMTVSGQLEAECFAQSHTDVYTFGPTFRAENSNTPRHAAEFWMIEPEIAFADLNDVVALAEDFVRTVSLKTLDQCADDFDFFDQRIERGVVESVRSAMARPFARVTYREAQELLRGSGQRFEFPVGFGESLQAEHERFLAEEVFKGPVFVTDYPSSQKAFYMRRNDDGETVAATDLLVPRLGEMLGGSQREERLAVLLELMASHKVNPTDMDWYLDLRRYGTTPHGGFGLGFERMLMWLTGMKNIRDVIPFPRTPGHL